jgi:hypothetical protein
VIRAIKNWLTKNRNQIITALIAVLLCLCCILVTKIVDRLDYRKKQEEYLHMIDNLDDKIEKLNKENKALEESLDTQQDFVEVVNRLNSRIVELEDNVETLQEENGRLRIKEESSNWKDGTYVYSDEALISNVMMAASRLDGTIIRKDREVDVYDLLVGKYDYGYEYNIDGESEGYINGLEYVATTLYNAIRKAGLSTRGTYIDINKNIIIDADTTYYIINSSENDVKITATYNHNYLEIKIDID